MKLGRVTWVTQCEGSRDDNTGGVRSRAEPSSSGAQYRQSQDNFKHYSIICSPDVKHNSKLKDVISTTCGKMYIYICGRCAWRSAGFRFRLSSLCMCNSKISPLWGPIVIFDVVKIVCCDDRGFHSFQFISFPLISTHITLLCGTGSSVGIATDNGRDSPGSSPGGDEIFRTTRPALGLTQPPVKWEPGLSQG